MIRPWGPAQSERAPLGPTIAPTREELSMFGTTPFGLFHTIISLLAVAAGVVALVKYKEISTRTRAGMAYVALTVATCVTGFFIFHHGGFGKPHALGIIVLVVLTIAYAAEGSLMGRASRYVAVLGYSLTFFLHMIPAFTETATRIPSGHPLVPSPDAQGLQAAIGAAFVVFLIGAGLQVKRLRAERRAPQTHATQFA
jgi:uncharacterized membrane protein